MSRTHESEPSQRLKTPEPVWERRVAGLQEARFAEISVCVMVCISPGSNDTPWKPVSSRMGRAALMLRSEMKVGDGEDVVTHPRGLRDVAWTGIWSDGVSMWGVLGTKKPECRQECRHSGSQKD
jgi:hypothetical protein